jgi:TolB protein
MIGVDGTDLKQLTASQGNNEDPSWAPDGKHLAFSSDRLGRYSRTHIYIMRADGANQRQVTKEGLQNKAPGWGPAPPEVR